MNIANMGNEQNTNMIRVTLNSGYIASCLYDTGSVLNGISAEFVKKRKLTILPLEKKDIKFAKCANKSVARILGKVLLKFTIEKIEIETFFYIIPQLSHEIILGLPFMNDTFCEHNVVNCTLKLFNGLVTTTVYKNTDTLGLALVSKYCRIPANTEAIIPVRFDTLLPDTAVMLEPLEDQASKRKIKGLLVARVLVLTRGPKKCRVMNLGDTDIRLSRNTVIASISRVDELVANLGRDGIDSIEDVDSGIESPVDQHTSSFYNQTHEDHQSHNCPSNFGFQNFGDQFQQIDKRRAESNNDEPEPYDPNEPVDDRPADKYTIKELGIEITNPEMTDKQKQRFYDLCEKYSDIFALSNADLPATNRGALKLTLLPGAVPVRARPFHQSALATAEIAKQVAELLKNKWIRRSVSNWSSNCLLVKKSDGTMRLILDYRTLNNALQKEYHPLPSMIEIKDSLAAGNPTIFSTYDLRSGFSSLPVEESSKYLTAFRAGSSLYEFNRSPQGICVIPSYYSRLVNLILAEELPGYPTIANSVLLSYVDDLILGSKDLKIHLQHMEQLYIRLRRGKLRLNPKKVQLCKTSVQFLGQTITKDGFAPVPSKIEKLLQLKVPKNQKELKIYLGAVNYYRAYLPMFGRNSSSLNELLKKNTPYIWTEEHQKSYEAIQESLHHTPCLVFPIQGRELILTTDASLSGTAAILTQIDEKGVERVVQMMGRSLKGSERFFSITELELLSIVGG